MTTRSSVMGLVSLRAIHSVNPFSAYSALEVGLLHIMHYIDLRHTYLLTHSLTPSYLDPGNGSPSATNVVLLLVVFLLAVVIRFSIP